MQDRFKFRAWLHSDGLTPKMVYDIEKMDNFRTWIAQEDKDPVMQCTGLRDKNGKLIFEGDILRVTGSRDTSGYGVVEYLQAGCQFIVNGYLANPSPYHPRRKGEFCHPLQEWLCIEVIGNIYENPELLEEKC